MGRNALALIILTAGKSSRMGEPKALLRFGNWTCLELAVRNAAAAGIGRVLAVIGHRAEEVRAAHSFMGAGVDFQWVLNRSTESEQIDSLKLAVKTIERDAIEAFLFQPVDYPLVARADYEALVQAHRAHPGPEMVFIPCYGGQRGHPVLCREGMRRVILDLSTGQTARDAMEAGGIMHVELPNPGILEDMNTPDDYRRLRDIFRRGMGTQSPGRYGPGGRPLG